MLHKSKNTFLTKNIKEAPDVSILRKDPIRETDTTRKIYQGGSLMNPENKSPQKMSWLFQHKVNDEGGTDEKNCNIDDSQLENDYLVRNLDKEQYYKEDDE